MRNHPGGESHTLHTLAPRLATAPLTTHDHTNFLKNLRWTNGGTGRKGVVSLGFEKYLAFYKLYRKNVRNKITED